MDGQWESDDVERLVYELLRIEDQTKDQLWWIVFNSSRWLNSCWIKTVAAIKGSISMYFHSFCDRDAILGFCAYDVRVFTIHQRSMVGARVFSLVIGTFSEVLFLSCRSSALSRWVNMPPLPKLLTLKMSPRSY